MLKLFLVAVTAMTVLMTVTETNAASCDCKDVGGKAPVCGTDGKTYHNKDVLLCHKACSKTNLRIASRHPCQCICLNTKERLPVCASDGKTYINPGAVKCHNQCQKTNIRILAVLPCRKGDRELSS